MHAKFYKYSCGFSHSKVTITQCISLESLQNFRFGEHKFLYASCSILCKKFSLKFSNLLQNLGVRHMTLALASAEAYTEVGGGLSMSHFFRKISWLKPLNHIFDNSYKYCENL